LNNDIQFGSAAQSYDVAMIIAELFGDESSSKSPQEVIKSIEKMTPHNGATGFIRYSESSDSGKEIRMPVSMKIVRKNKIEVLSEDTGF